MKCFIVYSIAITIILNVSENEFSLFWELKKTISLSILVKVPNNVNSLNNTGGSWINISYTGSLDLIKWFCSVLRRIRRDTEALRSSISNENMCIRTPTEQCGNIHLFLCRYILK